MNRILTGRRHSVEKHDCVEEMWLEGRVEGEQDEIGYVVWNQRMREFEWRVDRTGPHYAGNLGALKVFR